MRACRTNFSPVFSLYTDRENRIVGALKNVAKGTPPDINFTDDSGESHRMWVVTDPGAIGEVQRIMADKRIFIADGHHRYETALNYKRERETSGGTDRGDTNQRCRLMFLRHLGQHQPQGLNQLQLRNDDFGHYI